MSYEARAALFLCLGAVIGAMVGWVTGKIIYDLDNRRSSSDKYTCLCCGLAVAAILAAATPNHWRWLACLAVYPAYLMFQETCQLIERQHAKKKQRSGYRAGELEDSDQSFYQGCGLIGSLMVGAITSAAAADHFGVIGGVIACAIGSVVLAAPAIGAVFVILILIAAVSVGTPALARQLTDAGASIGRRLTSLGESASKSISRGR